MSMFDELYNEIKFRISDLSRQILKDHVGPTEQDAKDFLQEIRQDLERYTRLLFEGDISPEDFGSLIEGKKRLIKQRLLVRGVLTEVQAERFATHLISFIVETVVRHVSDFGLAEMAEDEGGGSRDH